jgi:hypothetical protein
LVALVLTVAACGTTGQPARYAAPQVIEIGTHELDGRHGIGFVLDIRRLRLSRSGWEVEARVVNATPVTWSIAKPHSRGGTKFGLFLGRDPKALRPATLEAAARTTPQLLALNYDPPTPTALRPGEGWSGRFSGPGRIQRGTYIKFAFGTFTTDQPPPEGLPPRLMALTSKAVQVG